MGDIVHRLRTALDYVTWQLVLANGGKPNGQTAFPCVYPNHFSLDSIRRDYKQIVRRQVSGVAPPAKAVIESLPPWKAGPDEFAAHPLYVLTQLDNQDKHRTLHIVGAALNNSQLGAAGAGTVYFDYKATEAASLIVPIKDGTVLSRHTVVGGPQMKVRYRFTNTIAFAQDTIVAERRAVIPTLKQLIDFTNEAVGPLTGSSDRIGRGNYSLRQRSKLD